MSQLIPLLCMFNASLPSASERKPQLFQATMPLVVIRCLCHFIDRIPHAQFLRKEEAV